MTSNLVDYSVYFRVDQPSKVLVNMKDGKIIEISGVVRCIENNLINFDYSGSGVLDGRTVEPGSDLYLTSWSTWAYYRCKAVLVKEFSLRRFVFRLSGQVTEKQSREYFRIDTSLPLYYTILNKSSVSGCTEAWSQARTEKLGLPAPVMKRTPHGYGTVKWAGRGEIGPQRINLSANGLRLETQEYLDGRRLISLDLFLPLRTPQVLCIVAEVVRCNQVSKRNNSYSTALCFRLIEEKERESLIAFIFAEQRRILSDATNHELL